MKGQDTSAMHWKGGKYGTLRVQSDRGVGKKYVGGLRVSVCVIEIQRSQSPRRVKGNDLRSGGSVLRIHRRFAFFLLVDGNAPVTNLASLLLFDREVVLDLRRRT